MFQHQCFILLKKVNTVVHGSCHPVCGKIDHVKHGISNRSEAMLNFYPKKFGQSTYKYEIPA